MFNRKIYMKNFKECKDEWLEINQEEKILLTEVKRKIDIILKQQNEMGNLGFHVSKLSKK